MLFKEVIEALLFASQKPLSLREIATALRAALQDADDEAVRAASKLRSGELRGFIEELKQDYETQNHAFQVVEQAEGWTLVTRSEFAVWVRQLYPESKPTRLSGPALETLAIIAYRQPLTRADIEAVRGVAVDGVVQSLLDRGLIRISGRADVPGRPLLYETTEIFMQHFGLKTLDELPNVDELRRIKLPTATPATTGELFPPGAEPPGSATEPPAPDVAAAPPSDAAPALTPPIHLPETPLPTSDSPTSSQDHVADSDPQEN
jgi:segregation and condensation protein B